MYRHWVVNFTPDSSARTVVRAWMDKAVLLSARATSLEVRKFLLEIRQDLNLEMIDLLELRQYGRFCASRALSEKRQQLYSEFDEALNALVLDFGPTL